MAKSPPKLGYPVVYHCLEAHKTETLRGAETVSGSVHHPELEHFAGQITRVGDDGKHSLIIFPPNRPPVHIDDVAEGKGHGKFRSVGSTDQG